MTEGQLVIVTAKLDDKIKSRNNNDLIIGTFIGYISDKRVLILLSDTEIYLGEEYTVLPAEEQLT